MPQTLPVILNHFFRVANDNVRCPHCQERHRLWKNGFYWRYRPVGSGLEAIQRYLCRNVNCRRKSFSILPHPFLPRLRVGLCFLTALWELWATGRHTIAGLARQTGQGWAVMRRQLRRAQWLVAWLAREQDLALAGVHPCVHPHRDWTPLCQALSRARWPG